MKNILGRKVGMTSVFTDDGRHVPVTVIAAGPCTVVGLRTKEKHGYAAVALGFEPIKRRRLTRAQAGHFKKQGVEPVRVVREFRGEGAESELGQAVTVSGFEPGDRVDVVGVSKGHGFSGAIKRHNFSGGGASHGSMIHRQPASNGDTNAGRTVLRAAAGRGITASIARRCQNLEVVRADGERNLLLVRGAVPGGKNALVVVRQSVKSLRPSSFDKLRMTKPRRKGSAQRHRRLRKVVREIESPAVLNEDFGDKFTVVYRAVHREFANCRAGTASTLKRDEVRGRRT